MSVWHAVFSVFGGHSLWNHPMERAKTGPDTAENADGFFGIARRISAYKVSLQKGNLTSSSCRLVIERHVSRH